MSCRTIVIRLTLDGFNILKEVELSEKGGTFLTLCYNGFRNGRDAANYYNSLGYAVEIESYYLIGKRIKYNVYAE